VRTDSLDRDHAVIYQAEPAGARSSRAWAFALAASMVLLICIRLFSEDLRLVPRLAQYIDVPITVILGFCAILSFVRRGHRPGSPRFGVVLYVFFTLSLISALVNVSRSELLPVGMFIFDFAAPLVFLVVTIHVRLKRKDIGYVVRVFFWLGVLQLAIGLVYDLPRFLATNNPDFVSGTFGQNAYQFTYFLGLWLLYVLGGVVLRPESRRRWQGVAIALATLAVFALFYAAQYRAMLIFFTLILLVVLWVSPARVSSRVMLTMVISVISIVTLIVIGTAFPNLKLLRVFDLFDDTTPILQSGKLQVVENVGSMYADLPQAGLIGSGPATFSSRAYVLFSNEPRPGKEAVGVVAIGLMGGHLYSTDVASKYVATINAKPIQGGTTASSPLSSYTSLAAEVGIVGLFLYLSAYFLALRYSYRRLRASATADDRVGAQLAFACFGGLLLLLVQTFFDNWLEVTRVTIPLWILVGLLYSLGSLDQVPGQAASVSVKTGILNPSGREAR
jgi:hypothetical protein